MNSLLVRVISLPMRLSRLGCSANAGGGLGPHKAAPRGGGVPPRTALYLNMMSLLYFGLSNIVLHLLH